ncbi:MAG: RNA-binding protein [Flavipsychrobacter sp.]|nr:RNA-binding protein [Flavipsychrobacter sp.]
MVKVGEFNALRVIRTVDFGVFLDDEKEGILLPKRFVPAGLKVGDELEVFVYHDSEDRLIATTQKPLGTVGDIVALKAVSATNQGAFLDWGLMKDLFVPKSKQLSTMRVGGTYIVKIYIDEQTGRVAATEKIENFLSNEDLGLKEKEPVDLLVYRRTDIGYLCIINGKHTGVLHFSDIYQNIQVGDRLKGYIRKIREENKIDLALGERGYQRVSGEAGKILELLDQHGGFLPYHDKSDPEDIYDNLGMSKKAFKMAIGNLFKLKLIRIKENGIEKI